MRRAAPDPADEPGRGPAQDDIWRRPGAGGGRSRGATGTDIPPEPVLDARGGAAPSAPPTGPVSYPAQRRREDTWPPRSEPEPDTSRRHGRTTRGRPTPPHGIPLPEAGPPAPRDGAATHPGAELGAAAPATEDGPVAEDPAADHEEILADDPPDDLPDEDGSTAEGWALVHAAQDGDTEAFGRLFDRYHETVFRFVLFRLGDRPAAEDLTQETFVRAFRRISSVSYQGRDIGAWFVTIARNLVLDHVKSSRYRLETATPEIADVAPGSPRPGPESEVIAGATHAELLTWVAKLGDDQQECISLRFLQGLSVAETAAIMGRNEGAVKALQHRAVRRLAQLLPEGLR